MFPSAAEAWSSLQALNHDVALGWFIRAIARMGLELHGGDRSDSHGPGVSVRSLQISRASSPGSSACFCLLMTLGMAFSGQVLRFDQDAYWGLGIGASIASRVPIVGPAIGEADARRTDHRRGHAFPILRAARIRDSRNADRLRVACILLMVLKLGINEWPMPGRLVKRATYDQRISRADEEGWRAVCSLRGVEGYVLRGFRFCWPSPRARCTSARSARPGRPDPTIIQTAPKPDYFFLWLYALLSLLPPSMETPALLIGPGRGDHRLASSSVSFR